MHKLPSLLLLCVLGLALSGCIVASPRLGGQLRGSGNVTTETRAVGAFTAIDVSGVGEVIITQGDTAQLTVETDDNLQQILLSEVRDGTLHLGIIPNAGLNLTDATRMIFTVTVQELTQITLSGAATISVSAFSGDQVRVDHSGAGMVTLSGAVVEQDVTLSGAGSYDGAALLSERATVDLSGLGNVVVNVREQLDATVSGMGSIEYIGSPELHENVTGLGSIRQRAP
jgi:hypothetical protein